MYNVYCIVWFIYPFQLVSVWYFCWIFYADSGIHLKTNLTMHMTQRANSKQLDIEKHWNTPSISINMLYYNNGSPWNQYSDIFKLNVCNVCNELRANIIIKLHIQRPWKWKQERKKNHIDNYWMIQCVHICFAFVSFAFSFCNVYGIQIKRLSRKQLNSIPGSSLKFAYYFFSKGSPLPVYVYIYYNRNSIVYTANIKIARKSYFRLSVSSRIEI